MSAQKSKDLKTQKKEPTVKNYMRGALRTATVMAGRSFGLVPLHHQRKLFLRIRRAWFLALLFLMLAAFPGFGQQSPDPNSHVASASAPTHRTSTPATPAASPAPAAPEVPAPAAPLPMPSMSRPLATAITH